MAAEGSYQASTYNLELDAEIQRLKAQVLLSWEKEARTLKWFGLADGMNVLEAGSGIFHRKTVRIAAKQFGNSGRN